MRTSRATRPPAGDDREHTIGGRDQPPREGDPFRLVGIEQALRGISLQHRRELPRQVHGVADARVHPLTADRAVDVSGISQQERASFPEAGRDAVVHMISRKPIHLRRR